jgi:hypothetical protein
VLSPVAVQIGLEAAPNAIHLAPTAAMSGHALTVSPLETTFENVRFGQVLFPSILHELRAALSARSAPVPDSCCAAGTGVKHA